MVFDLLNDCLWLGLHAALPQQVPSAHGHEGRERIPKQVWPAVPFARTAAMLTVNPKLRYEIAGGNRRRSVN